MENKTMLKEILNAIQLHGEQMNARMDNLEKELHSKIDNVRNDLEQKMDHLESKLESKMDKGFDRLSKKIDGHHEEIADLKETSNFLLSKVAKHEKKLLELSEHHN